MEKKAIIGGKEIAFRATALTPRLYRHITGRDLMRDMRQLGDAMKKALKARKVKDPGPAPEEPSAEYDAALKEYEQARADASLDVVDLEVFEDIAFVMAKQAAGEDFPATADEWLDSLDGVFSVFEVFPVLNDLWTANTLTTATPKKK